MIERLSEKETRFPFQTNVYSVSFNNVLYCAFQHSSVFLWTTRNGQLNVTPFDNGLSSCYNYTLYPSHTTTDLPHKYFLKLADFYTVNSTFPRIQRMLWFARFLKTPLTLLVQITRLER
jgi:hypothetical protein